MSKLVGPLLETPKAILNMKKLAKKLLREALIGQARFKKLQKIIRPYDDRAISWVHKSILYEEERRHDPSDRIKEELGEFKASDAIHPMLLQQALTLFATAKIAEDGLLENVSSCSQVMTDFVIPLEQLIDGKIPFNWEKAIDRPLISYAQPYLNTVVLGITQHIRNDFVTAFAKQDDRYGIVSPHDWIDTWCVVQSVTGETAPFFRDISGPNTWSATGPLLEWKDPGTFIKSQRDRPYILYAAKKGINLDGLVLPYAGIPRMLLKDPEAEKRREIQHVIEKMQLRAKLQKEFEEIKLLKL